jgi:hypothetical protein
MELWDSTLFYSCGHYPIGLRSLSLTDVDGRNLPFNIDLAAIDLHRDRERAIPRFDEFRRAIKLKNWEILTGETGEDTPMAKDLKAV